MIFIALGANLPSRYGLPVDTLQTALKRLANEGVIPVQVSRVWRTAPVPVSDQPDYYNAVIEVETRLSPERLLMLLKAIELDFGRERAVLNAARILDLDILSYGEEICEEESLVVPHPRLHERGFVLYPLREIAPDWLHPLLKRNISAMIEALMIDQKLNECQAESVLNLPLMHSRAMQNEH